MNKASRFFIVKPHFPLNSPRKNFEEKIPDFSGAPEKGAFFVQFAQVHDITDSDILEGWYTYKSEIMLYNRLVE